jgi:hypothetical protein
MAKGGAVCLFFALGREADDTVFLNVNEAGGFEAFEGHGDGGRRDGEPVGEGCGNDVVALRLGFEDGLEVILLGDGDGG